MNKEKIKQYVTGFMLSMDQTQIVLIKKNNPSWQRGLFNGVGGKVEKFEKPFEAMVREFEEETSVITSPTDWKLFTRLRRPGDYEVHFFFSKSNLALKTKTVEAEEIHLVDVENLPNNIIPNLRWLIPMLQDKRLSFESPIIISESNHS